MVLREPPLTEFEELPTVTFASQFIWHLHWQFSQISCWSELGEAERLPADPLEIWVLQMDSQSTKEKK